MWTEMCKDFGIYELNLDLQHSFFVGDAGGRVAFIKKGKAVAKDFSCSDRNFAHNVGLLYKTPEEFFLNESPREYVRNFDLDNHPFVDCGDINKARDNAGFGALDEQEVVLFCGPPGAGKSTFFRLILEPLGFKRINQDALKTKEKCMQAATVFLGGGFSIAIGRV
ncbi:DNA kinase/phosphatase Pnk1 [Niveomyces insectorum RCEF 264]|uniref:DNA kinase/phosphatase Pnk1 n=1 Tax=Niveomyces insectorum RCEF 264 TaxID=1081102 RepID=A0A167P014_9HYPO|nr:DNA kinase/phosphatase Pnk1 [Niveomyces insectorum RCEF 264]